jgi:hypothetical protein
MALVTVTISKEQEQALAKLLNPQQLKQSIFQAIKRTVKSGEVQIRREVQEIINVTTKGASRVIKGAVSSDGRSGYLRVTKKAMPLSLFKGARQTKSGVVVRTLVGGSPLRLRHAFLATVGTGGHRGVFVRGGKGAKRFPIKQRYGPSAFGLLEESGRMTRLGEQQTEKLMAVFEKNLASQIDRWLK